MRKVRFQLQRKLRQSTSKGNEFSARVSVSEILCPDFRKTLRKSLQMHCYVRCLSVASGTASDERSFYVSFASSFNLGVAITLFFLSIGDPMRAVDPG